MTSSPNASATPAAVPGTAPAAGAAARKRQRPGRFRKWALLGAGALVAALPIADRLAAAAAESRLADRIAERQEAVAGTPQVSIEGFPFLVEAAHGSYARVRVQADAVTGEGKPVRASVDLNDVTERAGGYSAKTAQARFTSPFSAMSAALGKGASLSADDGRLRIDRSVLGLPLTIEAEVRLLGTTVTVRPVAASLNGRPLDPNTPYLAAAFESKDHVLPDLPLSMTPTGVSVDDDGITVHATAKDVTLNEEA